MKPSFAIGNQRKKKAPALSLVALMDIFTVLVFFLMFNVHNDQALNGSSKIDDLPLSAQAVDHLAMNTQIDVLEIPNEKTVYFNGQKIAQDPNLNALSKQVLKYCEESKGKCARLAIEAPEAMPYPFVNHFVQWGKRLDFKDIYLIVTQKK
ncbi:MAG: ExbD/TolR family protein [Vibrio fluvialis]